MATKKAAISEVRVSINSQLPFNEIVAILNKALVVPELPGIKGCRPCLSGLDRFVIEDIAMKGMR
jgi:hypothetical protein